MKIGILRHRVTIQEKIVADDELKQQSETWTDIATVWASVEPLSGREYFASKQVNADISVKITMRCRKDITPDMRVVFNEVVYEILSVINPEERNISLILMCREAVI
jgi:SPP1 family predicted phage head-tail adaptor